MAVHSRQRIDDAVIVGAGAVALASALWLHHAGFQVRLVVDREPAPWDPAHPLDVRVYALAPDVLAGLEGLPHGISLRSARCTPYRRMQVEDASSRGRLNFDAATQGWNELGCIVEHGWLLHWLWQQVHALGIPLHVFPGTLEWLDAGDHWRLPDLGCRTRLLLAADGGRSPLRHAAGLAVDAGDYPQTGLVATLALAGYPADLAWQRFLPEGPLALLPMGAGRASLVWSLPHARAAALRDAAESEFLTALNAALDGHHTVTALEGDRAGFPLRWLLAREYAVGRLALLGDAAHITHPMAGQGLNLGLRDALCLTTHLQHARSRGLDLQRALRPYARERRSENTLAITGTDLIGKVFQASGAWPSLRAVGMNLIDGLAPVRHALVRLAAGRLQRPFGP